MGRLFGTDGVRGVANDELSVELVYKLGETVTYILRKEKDKKPAIAVGRDTRVSGDMLEAALMAGIMAGGGDVYYLGVIPTPAVAYLTRYYNADTGAVISASHNPMEFNGIKFFNGDGFKLPDEMEDDIEARLEENKGVRPTRFEIGRRYDMKDAEEVYIDFLKGIEELDIKGLKIALDCANGASYRVAPALFKALGADVRVINNVPTGLNINHKCGSTHIEALQEYVREIGAKVGLAFDGDADRLIAVDEKGNVVNGDSIMAICGLDLKGRGLLNKDTVVATVMSNLGLEVALKEHGIRLIRTKVGDRYVLEEMKRCGYSLGGEQSGHIIFLEASTTGDGLITALKLLGAVKRSGKNLSELVGIVPDFPQTLINARVANNKKECYMDDEVILKEIKRIEEHFDGRGRVVIRPSGTEPLVRVMIEGDNLEEVKREAEGLARLIEERLS
ncbi:MAG: phosphoglucosamine mutase [Thermoanaerobacteraceae bacterium]|nr:phosphoglucosamine mutase [Thermoanaerobacteraceae bacterium]